MSNTDHELVAELGVVLTRQQYSPVEHISLEGSQQNRSLDDATV